MRESQPVKAFAAVGLSLLVLAGCASDRSPPINSSLPHYLQLGRDPSGKLVTSYKVGNPYQVAGLWYYPAEDFGYREEGIASWYGPNFHGKRTANGEVYDMNALTAAHKTLPIPSVVKVTNLENGRSMKLRINDRGPFVDGRIIDLSRRAAQELDVIRSGIARVRVELVPEDSLTLRNLALDARGQPLNAEMPTVVASPRGPVVAETLIPPVAVMSPPVNIPVPSSQAPTITSTPLAPPPAAMTETASVITTLPASATKSRIFVQAGAFTDINNARMIEAQLSGIGNISLEMADIEGRVFHRVRVGPMIDHAAAQQLLSDMLSRGYDSARVVED
ncbi:MAG: septal ring lytic transglycosylase RlpA family protein [Rhodospirillaceae bacterium]|nr:septal ring lytic transglycosylase RlpA family protein [Rhodospirillaceae bacterium]